MIELPVIANLHLFYQLDFREQISLSGLPLLVTGIRMKMETPEYLRSAILIPFPDSALLGPHIPSNFYRIISWLSE